MTKSEGRRTKECRSPNDKERVATSALFRVSSFGFNSAFDIRTSLFESEWSFEGLNRNLFHADFRASSQIAHANLRVFVPEVRPHLRSVPVNARRAVPRMPEGTLPIAKMGTREGKAPSWHGCRYHLQGIWILHHRLSQRFVQRSCKKGVSSENCRGWRKIRRPKGNYEKSFACSDEDGRQKISKRIQRVTL